MRRHQLLAALVCMAFFGATSMAQDPNNLPRAKGVPSTDRQASKVECNLPIPSR